jgi:hypothetical protein
MKTKRLLCPQRVRRVPHQFSWIDQRLVRDGHISRCGGVQALGLYLLLVTVADSQGLSYYSDKTAARLLSLNEVDLRQARHNLVHAGLIAYQAPLYQVLSLEPTFEFFDLSLLRASLLRARGERSENKAGIFISN